MMLKSEGRVCHVAEFIRPGGGPAGYLYNLNSVAQIHSDRNFDILALRKIDERVNDSTSTGRLIKVMTNLPTSLRAVLLYLLHRRARQINIIDASTAEKLGRYTVIVFHDIKLYKSYVSKYQFEGQKVFLMPHSPSDSSMETILSYENMIQRRISQAWLVKSLQKSELETYSQCAGLIVPTPTSLDGYFQNDPNIRSQFDRIVAIKTYRVLSGLKGLNNSNCDDYRKLVNPNHKKLVIGYFGRYNEQKGFDLFLDIIKLFERDSDVQFICCGSGGLKPAKNIDNLIDFGWRSTDIAEIMGAVDIVLSPSQVAYFDLAILEALSLGTRVIASNVGGNKYFSDECLGVTLSARNVEDFSTAIYSVAQKVSLEDRKSIIKEFEDNFSEEVFFKNHVKLANDLLHKSGARL